MRLAAQSVDEGASSSSSGGSLAWDVEKNLMLQYAEDDEWRFCVDEQFGLKRPNFRKVKSVDAPEALCIN